MKKIIVFAISILVVVCLTGCNKQTDVDDQNELNNNIVLKAKVLKSEENGIIQVELIENSDFFQKDDIIEVIVENYENIDVTYEENMILSIEYNGDATRSIPPQINALSIGILGKDKK